MGSDHLPNIEHLLKANPTIAIGIVEIKQISEGDRKVARKLGS